MFKILLLLLDIFVFLINMLAFIVSDCETKGSKKVQICVVVVCFSAVLNICYTLLS